MDGKSEIHTHAFAADTNFNASSMSRLRQVMSMRHPSPHGMRPPHHLTQALCHQRTEEHRYTVGQWCKHPSREILKRLRASQQAGTGTPSWCPNESHACPPNARRRVKGCGRPQRFNTPSPCAPYHHPFTKSPPIELPHDSRGKAEWCPQARRGRGRRGAPKSEGSVISPNYHADSSLLTFHSLPASTSPRHKHSGACHHPSCPCCFSPELSFPRAPASRLACPRPWKVVDRHVCTYALRCLSSGYQVTTKATEKRA